MVPQAATPPRYELRALGGVDPLQTLRILERRAAATTVIAAGGRALRTLLRASR